MVISRSAFGFFGNALPAGLNAVVAGIGWFAVNSVSGALALHALFSALSKGLCLVVVVIAQMLIAFFGHNLVQAFERFAFPVLGGSARGWESCSSTGSCAGAPTSSRCSLTRPT